VSRAGALRTPAGLAEIRSVSGLREHCEWGRGNPDRSDIWNGASHDCKGERSKQAKPGADSKLIFKKALKQASKHGSPKRDDSTFEFHVFNRPFSTGCMRGGRRKPRMQPARPPIFRRSGLSESMKGDTSMFNLFFRPRSRLSRRAAPGGTGLDMRARTGCPVRDWARFDEGGKRPS